MKYRGPLLLRAGMVIFLLLPAACADGPIPSFYRPVLPELPGHWKEILGDAHWRLEWIGVDGTWQERDIPPGRVLPELSPAQEWTTAVIAWPFWPGRDLLPGMMRPAGALFPWDAAGETLLLSWKGGVDAFFWKSLAAAGRHPWYFDWPRFRALFSESFGNGAVSEAVRLDPWLVDWQGAARKTAVSGFSRRLIAARPFTELAVPGPGGLWTGSSPFAPPLDIPHGGPLPLKVPDTPDVWVSREGLLKASSAGWVFRPAGMP